MKVETLRRSRRSASIRSSARSASGPRAAYLARDLFERDVAIKVLQFKQGADPDTERIMHKTFVAEASLAGKLRHPHIVDIYDAVVEPDRSYLVMEYVAGKTLEEHLEPGQPAAAKVVEIIFKCIRALEYAFQNGIIHRDIKPGNIMLSADGDQGGDFGASFQQRLDDRTTAEGHRLAGVHVARAASHGDAHPPDRYLLARRDHVRLLTGRLPHEAGSQVALSYAIINTMPPKPSTHRPDLPPLLDEIVMKAIAKDPAQRYRSWLDFGKDMTRAFMNLRVEMTSPTPASDSEKFGKLRDMPFFRDFGDVQLWEVVRVASWLTIDPGSVLMRENEQGDSFYVLVEGECEVSLLGKTLTVLKPGGVFGEILYFAERVERRTTTVTAKTRITALQINAGALRIATPACQVGFNKAFMRVLVERLGQANRQLAQR